MGHSLKTNNMQIRKKTLEKYQIAIQEIVDLIKFRNGKVRSKEIISIAKKNKTSWTLVEDILNAKIIDKISIGHYKSNVEKVEPFHVRKAIEKRNTYMKELKDRKKVDYYKLKKQKNKKTISIFWGLIKINY